jgi:hypothetical protein
MPCLCACQVTGVLIMYDASSVSPHQHTQQNMKSLGVLVHASQHLHVCLLSALLSATALSDKARHNPILVAAL